MGFEGTQYFLGNTPIITSFLGENLVLINPVDLPEYSVRTDEYGEYIVFASPGANLSSSSLSQLGMEYGWSDVSGQINGTNVNLTVLSSSIYLYSTSSEEYFVEYSGSTFESPDSFTSGGLFYGRSLLESTSSVFDFGSSSFTIESYIYRFGTLNTTIANKKLPTVSTTIDFYVATNPISFEETIVLELSPGNEVTASITGLIPTGSWYHIAATRSGSLFSLYLNGNRVGSKTSPGTLSSNPIAFRAFGGTYFGAPQQQPVLFSDYRVYNGISVYSGSTYTLPQSILYKTSL